MENQDFTTTILVNQSPQEAFKAITNLRAWWSASIEGITDELNAEFMYHYQDVHYCKMKLVELIPDQKVVWEVLDNYFKFTTDKSEWIGSKPTFTISQKGNQTEITFVHEGLVPQDECFEICREAWTNYITNSLYSLITTGKGQPNAKEADSFDAKLVEKWKLA
jgi:hypothetical protein